MPGFRKRKISLSFNSFKRCLNVDIKMVEKK